MTHSNNHYKIIDFLEDPSFVSYAWGTDQDSIKTWKSWLEGNPPNRDLAQKAYMLLSIMKKEGQQSPSFSKEEEFNKVLSRIQHREIINSNHSNKSLSIWLKIAAAIIILLSIGIGSYFLGPSLFLENSLSLNEVTVPKGSRTKIILEDGSTVWLNAESTLKYPSKFTRANRNVELIGEAYFNVVKSPKRPFIVKTTDVLINVLGTSFNVKAYPNEDVIETTLESGLVRIDKINVGGEEGNRILLKPQQKLIIYKNSLSTEIIEFDTTNNIDENKVFKDISDFKAPSLYSNFDTKLATSWKDGRLIFKGESLNTLTVKLEKWYNVNIQIADSTLNSRTFTGTFEKETIEQALKALCLASEINYSIENNNIIIHY